MVDEATIRFDVPPQEADWHYCAVIDLDNGETTYVDGYVAGDKPTRTALQEHSRCAHRWVAGMAYVHDEDAEAVAAVRPLSCEKCDRPYSQRDRRPLKIIEWEVKPTPRNPLYRGPVVTGGHQ